MAYQSRKRNYKSRREKLETAQRNTRVIFIFVLIALLFFILRNRLEIWSWLRTYFY